MGKSALVTGSTGLLGQSLCRRLCDEGWSVTAMCRASSDVRGLHDLDIELAVADILDREAVHRAVAGHDYVFHLAGVGLMDAVEKTVWRVNVEGTRNLLAACDSLDVERVLFTSTAGTRRNETGPATEVDVAQPLGAYQKSKAQAEKLLEKYVDDGGDAVTVHPTSVFGPGDEKFTSKLLLLATKPVPAYLPGGVSIVGVEDVTRGMVVAMEEGRRGEHYILGGQNLTFREAIGVLSELSGGSPPPVRIPPFVIHAAGPVVGALNQALGTRMFPVNREMARLSTRELFYSSKKAQAELDYTYEPLRSHAPAAIEWYRSAGDSNRAERERQPLTPHP